MNDVFVNGTAQATTKHSYKEYLGRTQLHTKADPPKYRIQTAKPGGRVDKVTRGAKSKQLSISAKRFTNTASLHTNQVETTKHSICKNFGMPREGFDMARVVVVP